MALGFLSEGIETNNNSGGQECPPHTIQKSSQEFVIPRVARNLLLPGTPSLSRSSATERGLHGGADSLRYDCQMEPDEIRAEIERRKRRAKDLKLRETIWALYYYHFRRYEEAMAKDPQFIYPEVVKETLKFSQKSIEFTIGTTAYQLIYKEGPASEGETERWGSRSGLPGDKTVPATLALSTDGQRVFKFEISRITTYHHDGPLFDELMGEVTCFIEGSWVVEVTELLTKIKAHEKDVRDMREAPKLAAKLAAERKRFGL